MALDKNKAGGFVSLYEFVVSTSGQLLKVIIFVFMVEQSSMMQQLVLCGLKIKSLLVEGWLWDLTCAEIKHIQSDKGFFAACAEKHQSYLRVFQELLLIINMLMLSMLFNNYVHRASLHVTCFTSLV